MTGITTVAAVVNAVVYAFLGIIVFALSFVVIDRLTPYALWKEIIEDHNVALAMVIGAMSLGICVIIAAAIHG
jgi:uncharacterized membrane protein YjfL (UPF0719 family)